VASGRISLLQGRWHDVGDALTAIARLRTDPVPRVQAAAERAVIILTASSS
jgi:hypothetical protein